MPSAQQPLTSEAILDATEDVLRRFGATRTSVVDVARALNVSHGSVYRHFASKAALRDAVTSRWLERLSQPLEQALVGTGSAADRLHDWLFALSGSKRGMAIADPELFAVFGELTAQSREVVAAHVEHLVEQLRGIVAEGMASGEFSAGDPRTVGRAILHATARFHHPALVSEWDSAEIDDELEAVYQLILRGLSRRGPSTR